jgi:hypothetical protein
VLCPIPEDPRDGFIRPDAFLRDVKRGDETPVFPALGNNFRCLQQTSDWCKLSDCNRFYRTYRLFTLEDF